MSDAQPGQIPLRPLPAPPRTRELPMAFTGLEFARGVLIALLVFNVVLPLLMLLAQIVSQLASGLPPLSGWGMMLLVPLYSAPVSALVAVTYGGLAAYLCGWFLRREPRVWVHRVSFLILGAFAGYLTAAVIALLTYGSPGGGLRGVLLEPSQFLFAAAAAVSVWAGWEWTSRRARRADARAARIPS